MTVTAAAGAITVEYVRVTTVDLIKRVIASEIAAACSSDVLYGAELGSVRIDWNLFFDSIILSGGTPTIMFEPMGTFTTGGIAMGKYIAGAITPVEINDTIAVFKLLEKDAADPDPTKASANKAVNCSSVAAGIELNIPFPSGSFAVRK